MKRPGNNPKRQIARADLLTEAERATLAHVVKYAASGHHKRNPADYGLHRTNPRPTKSLCDMLQIVKLEEAKRMICKGILCGMISEFFFDAYPKFVWCVGEDGEVYEAKTDAMTPSVYHGYRLEEDDNMRDHVRRYGSSDVRKLVHKGGLGAARFRFTGGAGLLCCARNQAHDTWLTEGSDVLANRLRQAPLLSAYHFAEWLAWNWWRLRWEPRSNAKDWAYAHRIATIGSGYIWPNLTIFSDGERTALIAKPTEERPQTPFRYITDRAVVIPASEFETELDLFIDQVLERLHWAKVADSNLEEIWRGVRKERRTPELARARKLEALLGQDPDELDPEIVERLLADAEQLSISAIEELAAEHGQREKIFTADEMREMQIGAGLTHRRKVLCVWPVASCRAGDKSRHGGLELGPRRLCGNKKDWTVSPYRTRN